MHFSSRVDGSRPNAISMAEARCRRDGVALTKLNDSNPTRHGLAPALVPGVYEANPRGPLAARRALAEFLAAGGIDRPVEEARAVDPERLYLLSSTSEAYSWLMKLLCDPGDAVLAPKPGYPLIESIARLENVETIEYSLMFDGSWFFDLSRIEEILDSDEGARIRAMVLINPNNPTGSYVKPEERRRLVAMCREHDVAIIADEVFFGYALEPFDGNARLAGESGVLTFALDGFSKMLAAPHAKVGWIEVSGPGSDVAEAQARLDVIADDFLPMSDIIAERIPDLLAAAAGQTARVRERTRGNLARLHELLDADPLGVTSVLRAEGGWNVLLRFPSSIDESELVLSLIRDHRATAQPGFFFDMTSNGYLAVSLLPEPDVFEAGIRAVLSTIGEMLGE
ncbi:aminotransferase class I/II-fold pyridoxal phosphate-dependent enzyme [Bifidobacterium sp. SMB2]|uniref:alanine transaminase n=1 Tax=Bifidobacterium saimiriisciurei TaxID=2661627 RepID=A0ABX0C9Y2_9BIFI|nr:MULTISPECIES: pyridoxal phosphate-dependent aminotransferase [Bifidobacterium]NEG95625.1 aminotransferase class I/II-fold pyridoxal phosphate-dependent enzyme [Bifidobacterium sp. SMB2]NEH11938.1 aminotransferase class I/II-fold pyridoxal phosphate-dependent enzyme [Bifidobacterium saimiriisciurei]